MKIIDIHKIEKPHWKKMGVLFTILWMVTSLCKCNYFKQIVRFRT